MRPPDRPRNAPLKCARACVCVPGADLWLRWDFSSSAHTLRLAISVMECFSPKKCARVRSWKLCNQFRSKTIDNLLILIGLIWILL